MSGPQKASHRLLKTLIGSHYADKGLDPTPSDFDLVSRVFQQAGGSWSGIFLGSSKDITLLKKVLRVAVAKNHISKASDWNK